MYIYIYRLGIARQQKTNMFMKCLNCVQPSVCQRKAMYLLICTDQFKIMIKPSTIMNISVLNTGQVFLHNKYTQFVFRPLSTFFFLISRAMVIPCVLFSLFSTSQVMLYFCQVLCPLLFHRRGFDAFFLRVFNVSCMVVMPFVEILCLCLYCPEDG